VDANDNKTAELAALIAAIRERVRARNPQGAAGDLTLPDLMPVVHARDAAGAKVAAIGMVNPRPGGPLNAAVQAVKRIIARWLGWFVREQADYNRGLLRCIDALIEAHNETNRCLAELSARVSSQSYGANADLVAHWEAWHTGWEQRLAANETRFLRSVAELQSAFQHRAMLMESNFRDSATAFQEVSTTLREISAAAQRESHASLDRALERLRSDFEAAVARQHSNFEAALRTAANEIQQKLSGDIESLRAQYQTMVHHDLRLIRQRANASEPQAISAASTPGQIEIDWVLFAHKFRGTEQRVRDSYARHTVHFKGCHDVADLGCGRGEFLEVARDASIGARGVDANHAMAEICRAKGLTVEETDIVTYLRALPDAALDGVFCGHVIEHLPAALLPELIRLCFAKMRPGAAIVLETPNPECLAIFATHFYLDPTHVRPVPPAQLAFYLEEAGFGGLETVRLNPAVDSMPTLAKLPSEFRNEFFGELDYSISARKPR